MKFASGLSNIECGGYFLLWIGAVLYSTSKVKTASETLVKDPEYGDFSVGWKILNGKEKDTSDYEWRIVKYILYEQFLWMTVHLIVGEILRWKNYDKLVPAAQTAVSLAYLAFCFNLPILCLVLLQPLIFELCSKFNRKIIIWIAEVFCLVLLHIFRIYPYFEITYDQYATVFLTLYWLNLRCIGYYISKLDNTRTYSFAYVLSYILYMPLLSTGPFVDFNIFVKRQEPLKTTFRERITKLCVSLCRFLFWMAFTDFCLHYFYASAISHYPQVVEKFDIWTLYGYGYCMGQYFHLKYVVLYGISTTLAKFENIAAPDIPKCIGRIHVYSDMWKYFDSGLYFFLRRYIYEPMKFKFPPFLASFMGFCFIFVWHGLTADIMIWSLLNYICVTIEAVFHSFYKNYKKECEAIFDETWRQRLGCMLAAPLLAISAISNFYFFAGIDIGILYFARFFSGDFQSTCLLLFLLYCCCQVSSYVKNKEIVERKKSKTN